MINPPVWLWSAATFGDIRDLREDTKRSVWKYLAGTTLRAVAASRDRDLVRGRFYEKQPTFGPAAGGDGAR